jgi:Cd(II)/Pb(II)-responsive transcriptional regulator
MQLRIGVLASRLGVQAETIRYYEREGLLPKPQRTDGNYRLYDAVQIERLTFIRNCRGFGMTLDEIRELLAIREEPDRECGRVNSLLDEHIHRVAERIEELQRLENQLQALRRRCGEAVNVRACGILSKLSKADVSDQGLAKTV